jgi:SAM-dependent methyltransferase
MKTANNGTRAGRGAALRPGLASLRSTVHRRRRAPQPKWDGGEVPPSHRGWEKATIQDGPVIMTSVSGEEADELARLARDRTVLEVGSAFGYSATVMALAGARVTAIDPHRGETWLGDTFTAMEANLQTHGVRDQVEILPELSYVAMPQLTHGKRRFDLVFIDGDHTYDAVRADVANALNLVAPDGIIACHDYGEDCCCPDVRRALDSMFPGGPDKLTGTLFAVAPA